MSADDALLHVWEPIVLADSAGEWTERMRVPGGWLYRVIVRDDTTTSLALTFVPAPEQRW